MRPSKAEEGNAFLAGGASVKMSLSGVGCGGQNAKMPMCTLRRKDGRRRAYITKRGRAANYVSTNGTRGHNQPRYEEGNENEALAPS